MLHIDTRACGLHSRYFTHTTTNVSWRLSRKAIVQNEEMSAEGKRHGESTYVGETSELASRQFTVPKTSRAKFSALRQPRAR